MLYIIFIAVMKLVMTIMTLPYLLMETDSFLLPSSSDSNKMDPDILSLSECFTITLLKMYMFINHYMYILFALVFGAFFHILIMLKLPTP